MRRFLLSLSLVILSYFTAMPTHAADSIQEGLKANPETTDFYQTLVDTNVISELDPNMKYMVFAPVNSQFNAVMKDRAKCYAIPECKAFLANLMRHHIVAGTQSLRDIVKYKRGIFSINNHFIPLQQYGAMYPTVEGANVLEMKKYNNGTLYLTNGVLVSSPYNLSLLDAYQQLTSQEDVEKTTTTTHKTTIPDPACGPEGCPESSTTVTTIKRSVTVVKP